MSEIIKVMVRKLFPFMLLFGFYIISYGHLSPGGGFSGGVVLATAIIALAISHGLKETEGRLKADHLTTIERFSILAFVILGLAGVLFGHFLVNFPSKGEEGKLLSGGLIPFLNIIIGLKVGAAICLCFYALVKFRGEI
jgi:multicomponent Na+:H+ antiporter subunit B